MFYAAWTGPLGDAPLQSVAQRLRERRASRQTAGGEEGGGGGGHRGGAGQGGGATRARSHCRFVPPLIYFIPDSLT
jgi:hypothetical protein